MNTECSMKLSSDISIILAMFIMVLCYMVDSSKNGKYSIVSLHFERSFFSFAQTTYSDMSVHISPCIMDSVDAGYMSTCININGSLTFILDVHYWFSIKYSMQYNTY